MKSLIVFLSCALLTISFEVSAQTSTATSSESGGFLETVINGVTGIKDQVQEQITGTRPLQDAVLTKRTQQRIINLAANISNRFEGLIARLENITGRLQKRADKLKAEGHDVSAANASLESARSSLASAKSQLSHIDNDVYDAVGSTDPRGDWQKVRQQFLTARDAIKAAHGALRATIVELKDSSVTSVSTVTASSSEPAP